MDSGKGNFSPESLPIELRSAIGEIRAVQEFIPGVCYLTAQKEGQTAENFYVVTEFAAIYTAVRNYGQEYPGARLYAVSQDASGWRIVEYELCKYQVVNNKTLASQETEQELHRIAVFAAGYHPEYFGAYPVPVYTSRGYMLRHQKLENGIYWLETSQCEELLAVCYPIWNTEFTSIVRVIGEPTEDDRKQGFDKTMGYLFFSRRSSCAALYELIQTRPSWEGTLIDKPALMNAIWQYCPQYAAMVPKLEQTEWKNYLSRIRVEREKIIGIYPEAGEDFLLFRKTL